MQLNPEGFLLLLLPVSCMRVTRVANTAIKQEGYRLKSARFTPSVTELWAMLS